MFKALTEEQIQPETWKTQRRNEKGLIFLAQQVKVLEVKPKNLSLILETHMGEGDNLLLQVVLWSSQCKHVHTCLHIHRNAETQVNKTYYILKWDPKNKIPVTESMSSVGKKI